MGYMFAAYVITLLTILGYVISLVRRQKQVERETEALAQVLEQEQTL